MAAGWGSSRDCASFAKFRLIAAPIIKASGAPLD
jgi:hypothetical protein